MDKIVILIGTEAALSTRSPCCVFVLLIEDKNLVWRSAKLAVIPGRLKVKVVLMIHDESFITFTHSCPLLFPFRNLGNVKFTQVYPRWSPFRKLGINRVFVPLS